MKLSRPTETVNHEWCRVYWGSHGCNLKRDHAGHHECDCCECEAHPDDQSCVGKFPYYGSDTRFYGEDVKATELKVDDL